MTKELMKYSRYVKELNHYISTTCNATMDGLWSEIFQPLAQKCINSQITYETDNVYYDTLFGRNVICLSIKLDKRFFDVQENDSNEIFYFELMYANNASPELLFGVQRPEEVQEIIQSIQNQLDSQTNFDEDYLDKSVSVSIGLHILRLIRNINLCAKQSYTKYLSDGIGKENDDDKYEDL